MAKLPMQRTGRVISMRGKENGCRLARDTSAFTVTSHERHDFSYQMATRLPVQQLVRANSNENIKAPHCMQNHRWQVDSPHKGPIMRFYVVTSSCGAAMIVVNVSVVILAKVFALVVLKVVKWYKKSSSDENFVKMSFPYQWLRPQQNGRHFVYSIFKCIDWKCFVFWWKCHWKFVSRSLINTASGDDFVAIKRQATIRWGHYNGDDNAGCICGVIVIITIINAKRRY